MGGIKQQSSATMLCIFARCERFLSSVYQWENKTMIRIFSVVFDTIFAGELSALAYV